MYKHVDRAVYFPVTVDRDGVVTEVDGIIPDIPDDSLDIKELILKTISNRCGQLACGAKTRLIERDGVPVELVAWCTTLQCPQIETETEPATAAS